jgi:hypothetical protein
MAMHTTTLLGVVLIALPIALASGQRPPRLDGTWRAKTADGPQTVIVRADSSASWGDETVRWRVVADSIFIAMGDEWMVYNFTLSGRRLTLSGGDLEEPIQLERTGPATARPDTVAVPPAPPMTSRAQGASPEP